MKYSLSDTAWNRIANKVDADMRALRRADGDSPRHMLRSWYAALAAEDCYRPHRVDWFESFFLRCRSDDGLGHHAHLALTLAAAICWEWEQAHRVAMGFRDSIRHLTSWDPETEPRQWIDSDAIHREERGDE